MQNKSLKNLREPILLNEGNFKRRYPTQIHRNTDFTFQLNQNSPADLNDLRRTNH